MKMKVSQFVYGDFALDDSWFTKYVKPINQMYCDLHGYEYVVEQTGMEKHRHPSWAKVQHIARHLDGCDYLFYLDADACFYHHEVALHEDIIPLMEDKIILVPGDAVGEKYRWNTDKPCDGVMLCKSTSLVKEIVSEWDTVCDLPAYEYTRYDHPNEQAAFADYIFPKYQEHIVVFKDYYALQSIWGWLRHITSSQCDIEGINRADYFEQIYNSPRITRARNNAKA
jgi:hypothetical protein